MTIFCGKTNDFTTPIENTKTYKEREDISCLVVGVQNIWSNNSNIIENFQKFPEKKICEKQGEVVGRGGVVGCNRPDRRMVPNMAQTCVTWSK